MSDEVFNKELKQAIKKAIDNNKITTLTQMKDKVYFSNVNEFKEFFDEIKGNQGIIKTPYKDIKVNLFYAHDHFTKNTHNINRNNIKSAFFETFKDPLFIIEFTPQGKNKSSVYFYKPFYDESKKLLNLIGIGVSGQRQLNFSTFYLDKQGNRLNEFLKKKDILIRYVKTNE